jgi:VWFA-related protein
MFPMQSADLLTDYDHVSFGDGTAFVLPVTATVATRFRGEEATRNVVQFRNCQKFRAKTHIVLDIPGSTDAVAAVNRAANSADVVQQELAENETIYAVLREQAIRENAAHLQDEQKIDLNTATLDRLQRLAALEKERQKNQFELEARAKKESTIAAERKDATPSFKMSVKLVQVSVVLRDPKGRAVGNLRKEDFQLFDNRSPQKITSFSLETSAHAQVSSAGQDATKATGAADDENSSSPGERDVAYVFDDLHTTFADLAGSREAASRRIAALRAEGRAAIFTTSGEVQLTFTSDRDKLQEALQALRPHPIRSTANCPPLTLFTANLVVQGDLDALSTAIQDTVNCEFGGMASSPAELRRAEQVARGRALEVLNAGSAENQSTLSSLQEVMRRVAEAHGTRVIVLVSPGFLMQTPETREAVMDLIDLAVRSNIVIHTLDVKGLATSGVSGDSRRPGSPQRLQLTSAEVSAQGEVMAEFAYGTGGTYFHNSNDLDEGFRRTADPPEYIYVLGFSPQKLDGKFHKLKVTFSGPEKLTLQAREGYYALKPGSEK